MKVIFHTNIDAYQANCFPTNFDTPPRAGDLVSVTSTFFSYFRDKKLPARLEVTRVTWMEAESTKDATVVCELWYNATDKKIADIAGATTL